MNNYKKRLLKIFFPIMLSNLISQVQMLIDRIFLGHIDVINMSAVGNASNLLWASMSFVFSLSVGSSILISQAVGEGNKEKTFEYSGSLLKYHNIIPIILFFFWMFFSPFVFDLMGVSSEVKELCVVYTRFYSPIFLIIGLGSSSMVIMQTSNHTKHFVTYGIIRSVINIVLDYIMIFGRFGFPKMGIAGAALATTIAEYAGIGISMIVFLKSRKLTTRPTFKALKEAKLSSYIQASRLGLNTAFEDFTWNFGNLGIIRILNSINSIAAGIYSIVFSFEILAVGIIGSIGNGTLTLCGEATGAKDLSGLRKVTKTSYLWSAGVALFTLLMTLLFPKQLLSVFTNDAGVINSSSLFLMLMAINLFGKGGNIIVGSGIRGYGDTKWMFYTQIFGTILVLSIACVFVYVFKLEITGVYLAVICDELIRALINTKRFTKIKF